MKRAILVTTLFVYTVVVLRFGAVKGESTVHRRQLASDREELGLVIASARAFAEVEIHEFSGGGAYLAGMVAT